MSGIGRFHKIAKSWANPYRVAIAQARAQHSRMLTLNGVGSAHENANAFHLLDRPLGNRHPDEFLTHQFHLWQSLFFAGPEYRAPAIQSIHLEDYLDTLRAQGDEDRFQLSMLLTAPRL